VTPSPKATSTPPNTATTLGDLAPSRAARALADDARRRCPGTEPINAPWTAEWRYWAGGARRHDRDLGRNPPQGRVDLLLARRPLGIWAAVLISYATRPSDDD